MSAETLIREARSEGVTITISPEGKISLSGKQADREKWAGILKPRRDEVIRLLMAPPSADLRAWRWRVSFADREPLLVSFSPEATHDEALELYPGATAAEPFIPNERTVGHLSPNEETTIRDWLVATGESDPETIAEVIEKCRGDVEARDYFLGRAREPFGREAFEERAGLCELDGGLTREEAEAVAWREDDRRRCAHCLNLLANGVCKIAEPGGAVSARRGYRPDTTILQRCAGYRPCPDDPDRRTGRERWPRL
jgi:hypothetical protein